VPFKKGPDYIDAGWLAMAAQRPLLQPRPFLMAGVDIWNSFVKRSSAADVSIVEGQPGLYDGVDIEGFLFHRGTGKSCSAPRSSWFWMRPR